MTALKKQETDPRFDDPDYILRTQRVPHETSHPDMF